MLAHSRVCLHKLRQVHGPRRVIGFPVWVVLLIKEQMFKYKSFFLAFKSRPEYIAFVPDFLLCTLKLRKDFSIFPSFEI